MHRIINIVYDDGSGRSRIRRPYKYYLHHLDLITYYLENTKNLFHNTIYIYYNILCNFQENYKALLN